MRRDDQLLEHRSLRRSPSTTQGPNPAAATTPGVLPGAEGGVRSNNTGSGGSGDKAKRVIKTPLLPATMTLRMPGPEDDTLLETKSSAAKTSVATTATAIPTGPVNGGSSTGSGELDVGPGFPDLAELSKVDSEDLLRVVHRMLMDLERLWRSTSRVLAGDPSGNGLSDVGGGCVVPSSLTFMHQKQFACVPHNREPAHLPVLVHFFWHHHQCPTTVSEPVASTSSLQPHLADAGKGRSAFTWDASRPKQRQ